MADNKDTLLEKLHEHLFADSDELPVLLDKDEQDIAIRIRDTFTKMLDCPYLPDSDIITYMMDTFQISKTTAYRDLSRTKILLGNVRSAAKEFQRYSANQMVREGYTLAMKAKNLMEVKQALTMIRAGEALVKINKLDKDEGEAIPWDDIVPIELQSSDDVSVIPGYERKFETREDLLAFQNKLRKKYGVDQAKITDVEIID
jgi:hypothetical protein